jgi:hypothetical protein
MDMRSFGPMECVLIIGIALLLFWPQKDRTSIQDALRELRDGFRELPVRDPQVLQFLIVALMLYLAVVFVAVMCSI